MPASAETVALRRASLPAPRIALVTADMDRHAREMLKAFRAAGAEVFPVELAEIAFDTQAPSGLILPHFGATLPDAVCVRTLDAGSFEQVTRRLGILHALQALGIFVSNDARAIERCVDKSMTSFLLARAGLPSPRSWAVETAAEAAAILSAEPGPLVLKPLFGAQGKGLKLIRSSDELPAPDDIGGVYYLQRFAGRQGEDGRWSDYRILVSEGRVAARMVRRAGGWITNIKQGAEGFAMAPDATLDELAIAAAAAVGADFCGVDLLHDAEGHPQVIEVNSMPAWSGLKRASGVDVAAVRARDLLARLHERRPPSAADRLACAG
ncbi:ATP-grasp domain-containing protein [Mangrovicella endophytica]|uniref:ATP-grasp domain-containing protein n=1 Tax=Mangrovicella endophytica TaxID=2066697 RepID=UPI000C9E4B61|nr:RimK family alpha-L-glutamate ligase [Mangrovicella endophytica]